MQTRFRGIDALWEVDRGEMMTTTQGRAAEEFCKVTGLWCLSGATPGDRPAQPSYIKQGVGRRLDHIMVSQEAMRYVWDARVVIEYGGTDHFPISMKVIYSGDDMHHHGCRKGGIRWRAERREEYVSEVERRLHTLHTSCRVKDMTCRELYSWLLREIPKAAEGAGMLPRIQRNDDGTDHRRDWKGAYKRALIREDVRHLRYLRMLGYGRSKPAMDLERIIKHKIRKVNRVVCEDRKERIRDHIRHRPGMAWEVIRKRKARVGLDLVEPAKLKHDLQVKYGEGGIAPERKVMENSACCELGADEHETLTQIQEDEVVWALRELKLESAEGLDGVGPAFWKLCMSE